MVAKTSLAEMKNYSTTLRTISSGTATFSMELSGYEAMDQTEQDRTIESVTGFAPLR